MRNLLIAAAILLTVTPALAATWNVDPAASRLTFTGEQSDEKFQGSFPKFTSMIDFDEAAPEKGKITITVDMASAQIEGKDRIEALPTSDWFAVKKFATTEFVSTSISKTGEHAYQAKGNLTIKGVSKEVTLPFTLANTGKSTIAKGSVTLSRKDFGIGSGQFASDEWVEYPVLVTYEIHASKP